jgi:hypothetical protein
MTTDPILQQATGDIGGFILANYRDKSGQLHAANAVNALGALAGIFAQVQARSLLRSGAIPQGGDALIEVTSKLGEKFYFGDAINRCLLEGTRESPSFWNVAAGAGGDPKIGEKVDVLEIARRTARDVGARDFGTPQIDARYKLTEHPVGVVQRHGPVLLRRFLEINLHPTQLTLAFGAVAQTLAAFAAGEISDVPVNVPMTRVDIVRLYMEAAIPTSKLDIAAVGMVVATP